MRTDDGFAAMDRVYRRAYADRVPISCMLELTKRCNFRCPHCYAQPHVGTIDTDLALDIIAQLSDMGCLSYTLTGGEAMLHPGFEEICLEIRRRLGVVTLFTNGFALDEERIEFLRIVKPQAVDVTLYGADDGTYRSFCGVDNGFATVLGNVERACAEGLPVYLKMFVTRENLSDFEKIRDLAADMGVPFRYDSFMFPTFSGERSPFDHSLSIGESLGLDCAMDDDAPDYWFNPIKREPEDGIESALAWAKLKQKVGRGKLFRCKAARSSLFVTCEGKARICYMIPEIEADLSRVKVRDAWQAFGRYATLPANSDSDCESCADRESCNVCPARLYLENGSISSTDRVESLCAVMREKHRLKNEWDLRSRQTGVKP